MSSPMHVVVRLGYQPHPINRKKYGLPRFALYWANPRRFKRPGLYLWAFNRQTLLFPVRRPAGTR